MKMGLELYMFLRYRAFAFISAMQIEIVAQINVLTIVHSLVKSP